MRCLIVEPSYHRIREWLWLEETLKDHPVEPRCHGQGHLSLDHVTQSSVEPVFEHFQQWGIPSFSGQPFPVPHHLHHHKILPFVQSTSTLFQFKTVAPCPIAAGLEKKSLSDFLASPLYIWRACNKVSP